MSKPLYITTTIPYVNADPHIGFAMELVQADAFARFARIMGREVFFNTGTDEHGQKIFEAAEKAGKPVQEYVEYYAEEVKRLKGALNISNDAFIRTTDPHHIAAAQEMWRRCDASGDIYKKKYAGLYCVGCEAYKTERELEDGHCALHPNLELQVIEEENYFFRFSKYEGKLLEYLAREDVIIPEWRRQEAIQFVTGGLEDFSISRQKKKLSWGVPVPEDESQVMYVWFDALTDYISTLGWPEDTEGDFRKFWEEGETLQMAGKDQVRFQSLMWQAMLLSAKIKNTDKIFYHGFINSGGQRMSKSLGNVISPYELVEKYGTDATRFLLLRHVHPTEDTDITWERLDEWYTADLVNGLGNQVARVMKLAEEYLPEPVQDPEGTQRDLSKLMENFRFELAVEQVWILIQHLDHTITTSEPFRVVKSDKDKGIELIKEQVRDLYHIALQLEPFMPETSKKIVAVVLANKKPENLFPRLG